MDNGRRRLDRLPVRIRCRGNQWIVGIIAVKRRHKNDADHQQHCDRNKEAIEGGFHGVDRGSRIATVIRIGRAGRQVGVALGHALTFFGFLWHLVPGTKKAGHREMTSPRIITLFRADYLAGVAGAACWAGGAGGGGGG